MILYWAPGAGLGHLTRALALCLPLRDLGLDARIATNSPFAAGIAALARCPIIDCAPNGIGALAWDTRLLVTDTFPVPSTPSVHIARRRKTPVDLSAATLVIEAEPLGIEGALQLPGPIRLMPGRIDPGPFDVRGKTLVVHSGPRQELDRLIALAAAPCVVVSPWTEPQYYPADNLYAEAAHVITGAGYNAMAGMLWHREKHTAIPFERRHDDQAARLRSFYREPVDGAAVAVEAIVNAWRAC